MSHSEKQTVYLQKPLSHFIKDFSQSLDVLLASDRKQYLKFFGHTDTFPSYIGALLFQYASETPYDDKMYHEKKKRSKTRGREVLKNFMCSFKEHVDISARIINAGAERQSPEAMQESNRTITQLHVLTRSSMPVLAYRLERKKCDYDHGIITQLYDALDRNISLSAIGKILETVPSGGFLQETQYLRQTLSTLRP